MVPAWYELAGYKGWPIATTDGGTDLQRKITALPWDKIIDKEGAKAVKLDIEIEEDKIGMFPEQEAKEKLVRQFRIEKGDLTKYGYTKECPGCIHVAKKRLTGIQGHRGHTIECRKRIREELKQDGVKRLER